MLRRTLTVDVESYSLANGRRNVVTCNTEVGTHLFSVEFGEVQALST